MFRCPAKNDICSFCGFRRLWSNVCSRRNQIINSQYYNQQPINDQQYTTTDSNFAHNQVNGNLHSHTGNNNNHYSVNTIAGPQSLQAHSNSMNWEVPVVSQDSSDPRIGFTTSPNSFTGVVSDQQKPQENFSASELVPRLHNQDWVDGHNLQKSQIATSKNS